MFDTSDWTLIPRINPSVLDARELDALHPPGYIVFYRHSHEYGERVREGNGEWVLERTSDGVAVANGTLEQMIDCLWLFPYARRATFAEDGMRLKPGIFYLDMQYGSSPTLPVRRNFERPSK